jgi:hypothetical protein
MLDMTSATLDMTSAARIWSRRAFLAGAAAGTASLAAKRRHLSQNPLNVYVAESGTFGQDSSFSTGILLLTAPERHLQRIHKLRKQHNYFTNFRYGINDRFRFSFVQDVIAAELNDPDTRFVMRVQNANDSVHRSAKIGSGYP